MSTKYLLFPAVILVTLLGCKDEAVEYCCLTTCDCAPTDTVIFTFGHFYGECGGEGCIEIYKADLSQRKLFEDVNDGYPNALDFYDGNFTSELPVQKYHLVSDLINYIPESLYEQEVIIGNPDGGDWGGLYFEIKSNDKHRFWLLDQMTQNVPEEYHVFVEEIKERITYIQY